MISHRQKLPSGLLPSARQRLTEFQAEKPGRVGLRSLASESEEIGDFKSCLNGDSLHSHNQDFNGPVEHVTMAVSIDTYTQLFIPRSIVPRLPAFLGRWLGAHKPYPRTPDYVLFLDIFIGSFVAILVIESVFMHSTVFIDHHSPVIIASYGATAILAFNVQLAPLAQPRNILFGHFLSALIGVCLMKLFWLSEGGRDHYWVGGAIAVGLASVVMSLFNCVHPPSGATALIPFIDEQVRQLGWWYLPVHLVSSVLIIGVACVTNNVLRTYPAYWWTSYKKPLPDVNEQENQESQMVSLLKDIVVPQGMKVTKEELSLLLDLSKRSMSPIDSTPS